MGPLGCSEKLVTNSQPTRVKTYDNICQKNMGNKRICGLKIIKNWKKNIDKNIQMYRV
jgi:hypothetical protein